MGGDIRIKERKDRESDGVCRENEEDT